MNANAWALEIVRGRESGRVYPLQPGETTLGNSLNGGRGIDLSPHEADGPRRMAAQHARIEYTGQGLVLRDLESPGGTFVNRQRILGGQTKPLASGDLIQLGGVQLKVVAGRQPAPSSSPAAAPAKPTAPATSRPAQQPAATARPTTSPGISAAPTSAVTLPAPFVLASGGACRTWDDFLTISAQRWSSLREELNSGRLGDYLRSIHRPTPHAQGNPDERLDAWLGSLPTTRPAQPELEVHPEKIVIRVASGGGIVQQKITLANTGYRLLRSTIKVDDRDAAWIRFLPDVAYETLVTVEKTEISLEVMIPEALHAPKVGSFRIDSNGGTQQVTVRVEPNVTAEFPDFGTAETPAVGVSLLEQIAHRSIRDRLIFGALGGFLVRFLIFLGERIGLGGASDTPPQLLGPALIFAVLGSLGAAFLAFRKGGPGEAVTSGFAGACGGLFVAALAVATCRAIEPLLGTGLSSSSFAMILVWIGLGIGTAGLTAWLIPHRSDVETSS